MILHNVVYHICSTVAIPVTNVIVAIFLWPTYLIPICRQRCLLCGWWCSTGGESAWRAAIWSSMQ